MLRTQQRIIVRQLKLKFGDVSDDVAWWISKMNSLEVLDAMVDRMLTANSVDEFVTSVGEFIAADR